MEAFELRLWDGRLGRWLTVDPKGQYFSPYLGMGNNPISLIDPDGGSTEGGPGDPPVVEGCVFFPTDDNYGGLNTSEISSGWMPLTKTYLLQLATEKGYSQRAIENKFEDTFDRFMKKQYTKLNYLRNTAEYPTEWPGRTSNPDGFSGGRILASNGQRGCIPNLVAYDVKTTGTATAIGGTSESDQGIRHASALYLMHKNTKYQKQGMLRLVYATVADTRIRPDFINKVKSVYNKEVRQMKAMYNVHTGNVYFKTTLSGKGDFSGIADEIDLLFGDEGVPLF